LRRPKRSRSRSAPKRCRDAHALLVSVYKDPSQPLDLRIDAAKAAIPFEKPRLSSFDGKVTASFSLGDLIRESMALDSGYEVLTIDAVRNGGLTES
jgi:hypothetical protein